MSENIHYTIKGTNFGDIIIVWRDHYEIKVNRILLPTQNMILREYSATPSITDNIRELAEDIAAFLEGNDVKFDLGIIDLDLCSPFQRSVIITEHGIPRGWVSTYGLIAKHIGMPHSSRAVGRALATNPFLIVIPCHRAVRSDGGLGGYQGGVEMKKKLLEMEGIQFNQFGKLKMNKVYYHS